MPGDLREHQMISYHESMVVQERVETLRREAERERLAAQVRRSQRERDQRAKRERKEAKRKGADGHQQAEGRAAGRAPGRRRVLRWGGSL
jgi:hypothetical protein